MSVIYKYPIQDAPVQTIALPGGAEILCVQVRHNRPFIWALVNPQAALCKRRIFVFATGEPLDDSRPGKYIGTYQLYAGKVIFHLYEEAPPPAAGDRLEVM